MKVLQIVHGFPPHNLAGTEIYTYNLSKELLKRNKVFVFHRISDLKKNEYECSYNKFEGLGIFTINNTFKYCDSFEKFYKNDTISGHFAKILDQLKPDVVHIQHLIFLSTTIVHEIKKRRIPIIFTLHDYWLICPQWHFLKKDLSICNNDDKSECVNCLDYQIYMKRIPKELYLVLRKFMPDFLLNFLKNSYLNLAKAGLSHKDMCAKIKERANHIEKLCQQIDFFIAPSEFLTKKFINFGIPKEKIKVIPHGINYEYFKGFKRKESTKLRFGFIGTILPAKGLDILINAFNKIENKNSELRIYGNLRSYKGFEYYPKYIKGIVKNKHIRFMGEFVYKNISEILSGIDILVFPSIWNENYPLTILEALSTQTPIIASKIGGIPELIQDKKNGLLFEPRNIFDLHDKMEFFINQPELFGKLQKSIEGPKSIEENVREIEELYKGLLKNN